MYFFVGIKGAGMSALAMVMKRLGYEVSGSDLDKHFFTEEGLIKDNIPFYPYNKDNIKAIANTVSEVIEKDIKDIESLESLVMYHLKIIYICI